MSIHLHSFSDSPLLPVGEWQNFIDAAGFPLQMGAKRNGKSPIWSELTEAEKRTLVFVGSHYEFFAADSLNGNLLQMLTLISVTANRLAWR